MGHSHGTNIGDHSIEEDTTLIRFGGVATSSDKSLTVEFLYRGSAVFFFGNKKVTGAAIFDDSFEAEVRVAAEKARTDGTGEMVKIRSPDQAEARQISRIIKSILPHARISAGLFDPRYRSHGHWNFQVFPGNDFVFSAWDPDKGAAGRFRPSRSGTPPTPKTEASFKSANSGGDSGQGDSLSGKRRPATSDSKTSEVQSREKRRVG